MRLFQLLNHRFPRHVGIMFLLTELPLQFMLNILYSSALSLCPSLLVLLLPDKTLLSKCLSTAFFSFSKCLQTAFFSFIKCLQSALSFFFKCLHTDIYELKIEIWLVWGGSRCQVVIIAGRSLFRLNVWLAGRGLHRRHVSCRSRTLQQSWVSR